MPAEPIRSSLAGQAGRQPGSSSRLLSSELSFNFPHIVSGLVVSGLELILALILCGAVYVVARLILSRAVAPRSPSLATWSAAAQLKARNILIASFFVILVGVLTFNGWLLMRGIDVRAYTVGAITSITVETQIAIAIAVAKLVLASAGLVIAARLLRRGIAKAENAINRWDQ